MSLFDDIRSAGARAPLRVGYEASKRLGGHRVVFGRLVRKTHEPIAGISPLRHPEVPPSIEAATIGAADRILDGVVELFGRQVEIGTEPDWHSRITTDGEWPDDPWWTIDLRSSDADVKWAWELGRHRHLVVLARATRLASGDAGYLSALGTQLRGWMSANPPERGVHWHSNLEIALRSISWLQILALCEERMDADITEAMWAHLDHAGRHLVADLPYTRAAMPNNHQLGDGLGLIALGMAFEDESWHERGERVFLQQLDRQFNRDGSMIEDSLSYQRFVLEILIMRAVLGGAPVEVYEAIEASTQFLIRLGALDGPVPQYGDWDEGRVLVTSGDASDMRGSVLCGLAIAGSGAPEEWRESYDEVAWYCYAGNPIAADTVVEDGSSVGGGFARARSDDTVVWLKSATAPFHGHADLSMVTMRHGDLWLVGDPGTGQYNGDLDVRNSFRMSAAHSVVRVEGADQLEPHRQFRWKHAAVGHLGAPMHIEGFTIMWCVHDAYTRLKPPRRVVRLVCMRDAEIAVRDVVEGPATELELTIPLGPETTVDDVRSIRLAAREWTLTVAAPDDDPRVTHRTAPWSRTYGSIEPSPVVDIAVTSAELAWGLTTYEENLAGWILDRAMVEFSDRTVSVRFVNEPQAS